MGRILGLDYGSKTVGVAVTDGLGLTVQPLKTITRDRESKLRKTLAEIAEIVSEYQVEKIVLGLPLNMDGTEGERVEKTRAFRELLEQRVTVPIEFEDERLTTMEAAEILTETGVKKEEQKQCIDQVAAQLILEGYLRGYGILGFMENNRILLSGEDGDMEMEILEETVIQGNTYILVTDAAEDEDGTCYVMKDVSGKDDPEATYEFVPDDEAEAIMQVFATLLEDDGITIEK